MRIKPVFLLICIVQYSISVAQNLIQNGSMTGIPGANTVAPFWLATLSTPDLNDTGQLKSTPNFHWCLGTPVSSPDGGTWQNVHTNEAFYQYVPGIIPGRTYRFSFYYCSQGIGTQFCTSATPAPPYILFSGVSGYINPPFTGNLFQWYYHSTLITPHSNFVAIEAKVDNGSLDPTYFAYDGFYLGLETLPLKLLSFSTKLIDKKLQLQWETVQEENCSHFVIERSNKQREYTTIGKVVALGVNNYSNNYNFTDKQVPNGINYYRLKMVDKDGQFTYSKVISVETINSSKAKIFPNPVAASTTIQLQLKIPERISITFLGSDGKVIINKTDNFISGTNNIVFNIEHLATGIYAVLITGQNTNEQLTFSKL